MNNLPPLWRENLTHMLGAGSHIPKKQHGYRNHFCAVLSIRNKDYESMIEMIEAGLVFAGVTINFNECQYFHATVAGCQAIGLSKAAIKRAMEGI